MYNNVGTRGLFEGNAVNLSLETAHLFRNQGGLDLLCRSADSMRSNEQLENIRKTVRKFHLNGLVCVGGTHTATDAAKVAEFIPDIRVAVLPATIDGTLFFSLSLPFTHTHISYSLILQ